MDFDTIILVAAEWIGVVAVGMLAGLSPQLRKIRPLQFMFPRREVSVTFTINTVLFIFSMLIYWRYFDSASSLGMLNSQYLWQRLILDLVGLAVCIAAIVIRKQPIRSMLWGKDALRPNLQFGLLLTVLVIFLRGKVFAITNGLDPIEGLALFQILIISIIEVTIFFGYSQPRLMGRFGETIGWLSSAGLFTLWQIIPLGFHGAGGESVYFQVGLAAGQSLLLGWITRKSRHVLAPSLYLAISQWLFLIK